MFNFICIAIFTTMITWLGWRRILDVFVVDDTFSSVSFLAIIHAICTLVLIVPMFYYLFMPVTSSVICFCLSAYYIFLLMVVLMDDFFTWFNTWPGEH